MKHDDHQKRLDACREFSIGSQVFVMPTRSDKPVTVLPRRPPAPQFAKDYGVQQMRQTDPWPNVPWKVEPLRMFRTKKEAVIWSTIVAAYLLFILFGPGGW